MDVAEIGSFHIGGGNVALRGRPPRRMVLTKGAPPVDFPVDGDFEVGQMYVQYVRLAAPRARYPLLLWHGGGMTGATWETTPDGRPGWHGLFLAAGHDVYVSDAVERGRAGWARFPEIYPEEPHVRSKQECWDLFRFGPPGTRIAYPRQQFPVEVFDQFAKQIVPRWVCNDALTQAAYDALVHHVGPCVIVTHSQSGNFGYRAALNAPDLVKGVIAIEPSGAPDPAVEPIAPLRAVPHLLIWGDYLAGDAFWQGLMPAAERYRAALAGQGGVADVLDLPARGIRGNSHFPMMDRNNAEVAALVQDWMGGQGLMR